MPHYSYTAQIAGGERISSSAEAASVSALAAGLAAQGAKIESVRELQSEVPQVRGIPYFEVLGIYRQIASAIEAGMPLAETLGMLSEESRSSQLKSLLYFLQSEVKRGIPLSEAMRLFPGIFPEVHIAVTKAGEESGRLDSALEELAEQAESFSNMSRRFASALVYPTVIACAALALLNFGFLAIVPKFKALFGDLGIKDYPPFTQLVFFVSTWVGPVTILIVVGLIILVGMIVTQRRAASGRMWLDMWKLRLPVVGQIVEKAALARFSGTLGMLLDAGVELPRAVRMASEGAGNGNIEVILKNVAAEVELGQSLSNSIDKATAMPPTMAWRIGVGEETGMLPDSLTKVSKLYARQVESLTSSLAGLVEPLLIICIGSGVMTLVVGMFLPIVAVIQNLCGFSG